MSRVENVKASRPETSREIYQTRLGVARVLELHGNTGHVANALKKTGPFYDIFKIC